MAESSSRDDGPGKEIRKAVESCNCANALKGQLDRLECQLKELKDVPFQLSAVLESLGMVHIRMHEMQQDLPPVDEDGDGESDGDSTAAASPSGQIDSGRRSLRSHLHPAKSRRSASTGSAAGIAGSSGACGESVHRFHRAVTISTMPIPQSPKPSPMGGGRRPSLSSNISKIHNRSRRPSACSLASSAKVIRNVSKENESGGSREVSSHHLRHGDSQALPDGCESRPAVADERSAEDPPPTPALPKGPSIESISPKSLGLGVGSKKRDSVLGNYEAPVTCSEQGWRRLVLHPHGCPRLTWDALIIVATVFTGLTLPLEIAYFDSRTPGLQGLIQSLVDVVFIVDVVLNFRTGYNEAGNVVLDPRRIAIFYTRTWFFMDVMAALPKLLAPSDGPGAWIFRILKLTRLARIGRLFGKLQQAHPHLKSLVLVRVVLMVMLFSNLLSCIWRLTRQSDETTLAPEADFWAAYIEDTYFVLMTVTTVGYGDIVPVCTGSRVFAIFVMLAAPFFSGAIVSSLTHFTQGFFSDQVEARIAEVTHYMDRFHVPSDMQRRVENNLYNRLRSHQRMDPELFNLLSPAVQRELTLALLGNTLLRFPLFREAPHAFVADLAQAHLWIACAVGDQVVEGDQLMEELVFVVQGRLLMHRQNVYPSDSEDDSPQTPGPCDIELMAGAWFGEACLFRQQCVHDASVFSVTESELALLPSSEYHRIKDKFPRLTERHSRIADAMLSKRLSLKHLAYKVPKEEKSRRVAPWTVSRFFDSSRNRRVVDSSGWQAVVA